MGKLDLVTTQMQSATQYPQSVLDHGSQQASTELWTIHLGKAIEGVIENMRHEQLDPKDIKDMQALWTPFWIFRK